MVHFWAVLNCSNKPGEKFTEVFFRFLAVNSKARVFIQQLQKKREEWLNALKRKGITEQKIPQLRICSDHFTSGKPALYDDENNPDWVPTVNMSYKGSHSGSEAALYEIKRQGVRGDVKRSSRFGEHYAKRCRRYPGNHYKF